MRDDAVGDSPAETAVTRLLQAVREHLGLEAAFIGEVKNGRRTFRFVDVASDANELLSVGGSDPADESYCGHVLAGRIPQFLSDPRSDPVAASLPVTHALPVGTHLSVPIRFTDGTVYGTFCCFSRQIEEHVHPRDVKALQLMADLTAEYLEPLEAAQREWQGRRARIERVLSDPEAMTVVFQPLRHLESMRITSVEALARFPGSGAGPDWFFGEAAQVGLGTELEVAAVSLATSALAVLPNDVRLNVNVSPETLYSDDFLSLVCALPKGRLVVEVTEHEAIEDYAELREASRRLAQHGIDLSVDDVGMGFSGFNRILESDPKELKLDAIVVRGVDSNPVKQALIETFCAFGKRAGFEIVAEGVETPAELQALRKLRVHTGQGYHLGRPTTLEAILAELRCSRRSAMHPDPGVTATSGD